MISITYGRVRQIWEAAGTGEGFIATLLRRELMWVGESLWEQLMEGLGAVPLAESFTAR